MLVLSRKAGESLYIGDGITVSITSISGGRVKLAIDAPPEVPILRGELLAKEIASPLPLGSVNAHSPVLATANS